MMGLRGMGLAHSYNFSKRGAGIRCPVYARLFEVLGPHTMRLVTAA